MKIEQGQEYQRRDGAKMTQHDAWRYGAWPWLGSDKVWRTNDGKSIDDSLPHDLVAEWPSEPEGDKIQGVEFSHVWYGEECTSDKDTAEDKPKTWGEMTDAEKGALLLGAFSGSVIEYWGPGLGEWLECGSVIISNFADVHAYRIRVAPVKGAVTIDVVGSSGGKWYTPGTLGSPSTHDITFPTTDGTPITGTYTNAAGDTIELAAFGIEASHE